MQQASALARRLYFGSDDQYLYLRLESFVSLKGYLVAAYLAPRGDGELRGRGIDCLASGRRMLRR